MAYETLNEYGSEVAYQVRAGEGVGVLCSGFLPVRMALMCSEQVRCVYELCEREFDDPCYRPQVYATAPTYTLEQASKQASNTCPDVGACLNNQCPCAYFMPCHAGVRTLHYTIRARTHAHSHCAR